MKDFAFLKDPKYSIQKHGYETFYQGLQKGGLKEMGLKGGDYFSPTKSPAAAISICPIAPSRPRARKSASKRTSTRITTSFFASPPTRPRRR